LAGERTALPTRSAITRAQAAHRTPVRPSTGTVAAVRTYPAIVQAQKRRLRSASGPEASRSPSAAASPAPVTTPTTAAEAPRWASSGPVTERAPS